MSARAARRPRDADPGPDPRTATPATAVRDVRVRLDPFPRGPDPGDPFPRDQQRSKVPRHRIPTSPPEPATVTVDLSPLDLGRTQRLASNAQWRALLARSGGTCEILGCSIPHQRCRAHHLQYWEHGGPTDLANLLLVCTHHHATLHAGLSAQPSPVGGGHQLRRPDRTPVPVPFRDRLPR